MDEYEREHAFNTGRTKERMMTVRFLRSDRVPLGLRKVAQYLATIILDGRHDPNYQPEMLETRRERRERHKTLVNEKISQSGTLNRDVHQLHLAGGAVPKGTVLHHVGFVREQDGHIVCQGWAEDERGSAMMVVCNLNDLDPTDATG